MPKRTTSLVVDDMRMACERITQYTEAISFDTFVEDIKTADATVLAQVVLWARVTCAMRDVFPLVKVRNALLSQ